VIQGPLGSDPGHMVTCGSDRDSWTLGFGDLRALREPSRTQPGLDCWILVLGSLLDISGLLRSPEDSWSP
jgi:hypothetical protein